MFAASEIDGFIHPLSDLEESIIAGHSEANRNPNHSTGGYVVSVDFSDTRSFTLPLCAPPGLEHPNDSLFFSIRSICLLSTHNRWSLRWTFHLGLTRTWLTLGRV